MFVARRPDDRLARRFAKTVGDAPGGAAFHVHLEIDLGIDWIVAFIAQGGEDTKNVGKRFGFLTVHNL
jgi:hypothetical protein